MMPIVIGLILVVRLFIERLLNHFGPLGSHKLGDLSIDIFIFFVSTVFFLNQIFRHRKIILPRAWIILALFGIICSASISYSLDRPTSLLEAVNLWAYIFLVVVLMNILDSVRHIRVMMFFVVLVAVIAAVEALYEYFFQLPWYIAHTTPQMLEGQRDLAQLIQTHRTPTLFLWPNTFAGFLVMVIPLSATFAFDFSDKVYKGFFAVISSVLLYTLFIELSISSWASLFVAVGIVFIYYRDYFLKSSLRPLMVGGFCILGALLAAVVVRKIGFSQMNSFSSRREFISFALDLIKQHPILGNGWASFGTASAPYAKDVNGLTNYAHNSYIQIFAETGILGIAVFLSFLFFCWKGTIEKLNKKYSWALVGAWIAFAACIIDNCSSYTMLLSNAALYWWVIVGILLSFQAAGGMSVGLRVKISLMIVSLLLLCLSARLIVAEYDYFTALPLIHDNIDQEKAVRLFGQADHLNPWDKKFELGESVAYYELFMTQGNRQDLQLAHDTVLKTMDQASLGAERQAIFNRIQAAL